MVEKLEEMGTTTSNSGLGCGLPGYPQSESAPFSVRMSTSFAEFGRMRKSSLVVTSKSKEPSAPIANTATGEPANNMPICHTITARNEMNQYKAEKPLKLSDEMFSDEWLLHWWTVCAKQAKFLPSSTHDAHR